MDDFPTFSRLAGIALIVLALVGPLAYCATQVEGPISGNALMLACINARGKWESGGFWGSAHCVFPEQTK